MGTTSPGPKWVSIPVQRLWLGRLLIGAVVFSNLQCALAFIINPSPYLNAYQLSGIPGLKAIQGFGILFVMWNVPYIVAIIHPCKYRLSLYEAFTMQSIGLLGESYLLVNLSPLYPNLAASILRFIVFDGIGLAALLVALLITGSGSSHTPGDR